MNKQNKLLIIIASVVGGIIGVLLGASIIVNVKSKHNLISIFNTLIQFVFILLCIGVAYELHIIINQTRRLDTKNSGK